MKKFIVAVGILIILAGISFYIKNLRGVGPALNPPPKDITEVINGSTSSPQATTGMPLTLPPGFSIAVFAKNLVNPRVMAFDPDGNLLVSIPSEGKVVAAIHDDKNGVADRTVTVLEGLNKPHGLALECFVLGLKIKTCRLYVAETNKVTSYAYDPATLQVSDGKKLFDLPGGGNHFTRTLLITPDRKLLVSVGSTCNVCHETDPTRATILEADLDGKNLHVFASGLRNSVFMALHPATGKVWATEMGRDLLGDDLPPDEINVISSPSLGSGQNSVPNFGWPICYGKNIHDTEFDKNTYIRNPCLAPFETPSLIDLPAHSAPLGLAFIPESDAWPKEYWDNLLVAYHGSWNRTIPTGYKVVRYKLNQEGKVLGVEDFITGWLTKAGALGRPVDLLFDPHGALYISDDKAGVIYRVLPPKK